MLKGFLLLHTSTVYFPVIHIALSLPAEEGWAGTAWEISEKLLAAPQPKVINSMSLTTANTSLIL